MAQKPIELSERTIPDHVVIPCPVRLFAQRFAAKCCTGCVHYRGLQIVADPATWPNGYRILCAHPIARRVSIIED